jgi:hypothetical protein
MISMILKESAIRNSKLIVKEQGLSTFFYFIAIILAEDLNIERWLGNQLTNYMIFPVLRIEFLKESVRVIAGEVVAVIFH